MAALYVNVSAANSDWLTRLSGETGVAKATIVNAILTEARTSGWQIEAVGARVTKPPGGE